VSQADRSTASDRGQLTHLASWLTDLIDGERTRTFQRSDTVVDAFLRRIHHSQETINAFITVMDDQVRADARAIEFGRARDTGSRPLEGLVVAVKDDIDVAGVPCTVGSVIYRDRIPERDARVVERLKAAGALIIGKVGLNEFAYGVTCDNAWFGAVRNPWDLTRIPGGSSGGSGAAVAADLCVAALGSDAGGSVRVPAALCGVSGLRPTLGTVPADGTHQVSWAMETVGPIARSVVDIARVLSVIADPPAPPQHEAIQALVEGNPANVEGIRVGLVTGFFLDTACPQVGSAIRGVADELAGLGAQVTEVELSAPQDAVDAGKVIIRADALAIHEELLRSRPDDYSQDVRSRLELGAEVTGVELARAYEQARQWTARVETALDKVDVLLTPTVAEDAPLRAGADMIAQTEEITSYTLPFSLAGVPALTVPCGLTERRLPMGAQIIGQRGRDDLALKVGIAYQQVTDWHRRRP
jgi:aspartyl-tRNA(Asn)/glutamyl-tRNA(Gln) amidotransferase subunit A